MVIQKDIFLNSEGDAWYNRTINADKGKTVQNDIWALFRNCLSWIDLSQTDLTILEIGCSDGRRLKAIQEKLQAKCYGVDPSLKAIEAGKKLNPTLNLQVGTADLLPFNDGMFDIVIFGFCLYLCDRKHLFKIACEADRVLKSNGYLCIIDFYSDIPYKNTYKHFLGLYSYKMDYSSMFKWNPTYSLVATIPSSHSGNFYQKALDERLALHILYKDLNAWHLKNPFVNDK